MGMLLHWNIFKNCDIVFQAPSLDEKVDLHFIAFVNVGGHLYELGKAHNLAVCLNDSHLAF